MFGFDRITSDAFLRAQGHDAVHLRDQGLQCLEYNEIIEKARGESRVDQATTELWGITDRKLREIRRSLREIGNEGHPSNTDKGIEA